MISPLPWRIDDGWEVICGSEPDIGIVPRHRHDVELIAAAPGLLAELCDELDRAEAEVARERNRADGWSRAHDDLKAELEAEKIERRRSERSLPCDISIDQDYYRSRVADLRRELAARGIIVPVWECPCGQIVNDAYESCHACKQPRAALAQKEQGK